jgi:hypothetical protein
MATPGTKAANTMAQIDLVYPSRALHGPLVHSKYDSIPLLERHDLRTRLRAGTLLGQHKFASGEISSWLA